MWGYIIFRKGVSVLKTHIREQFHPLNTICGNTVCIILNIHKKVVKIWVFFSCHSVFIILRTVFLSFWVIGSQLSQCFAVRNSVFFLSKTKTTVWSSDLVGKFKCLQLFAGCSELYINTFILIDFFSCNIIWIYKEQKKEAQSLKKSRNNSKKSWVISKQSFKNKSF